MNINQITTMITLGQLAIDFNNAAKAVVLAKDAYYQQLSEFGDLDAHSIKLDSRDERCADIIEFSKAEYAAFKAAKRNVYNVKRRIAAACRKAGV